MRRTQEDLAILNGYWFYRDEIISLETFLELLKKSKKRYEKKEQL